MTGGLLEVRRSRYREMALAIVLAVEEGQLLVPARRGRRGIETQS